MYLKERGHYECKIWESMSKQRTLTAKFDRGVDLQGRKDIMTQKVWTDERCFRPLLCTVKAELGRGQPGLMR